MAAPAVELIFTPDVLLDQSPELDAVILVSESKKDHGIVQVVRMKVKRPAHDRGNRLFFLFFLMKDERYKQDLERMIEAGQIKQLTLAKSHGFRYGFSCMPSYGLEEDEEAMRSLIARKERLWRTSPLAAVPFAVRRDETMAILQGALAREIRWDNFATTSVTEINVGGPRPEELEKDAFGLGIPSDYAHIVQLVSNFVETLVDAGIPRDLTRQLILDGGHFVSPVDLMLRDKIKEQVIRFQDLDRMHWQEPQFMRELLGGLNPPQVVSNEFRFDVYQCYIREASPTPMPERVVDDLTLDAKLVVQTAYRFCVPLAAALDRLEEDRELAEVDAELARSEDEEADAEGVEQVVTVEGGGEMLRTRWRFRYEG